MMLIAPNAYTLQPAVVLSLFYNGSEAEGRAHFKKYLELTEIPYEKIRILQEDNTKPGGQVYMSSAAVASLALPIPLKVHNLIRKFVETKISAILLYDLLISQDSIAFRRDKGIIAALIFHWEEPSPGKNALVSDMAKKIRAVLDERQPSSFTVSARMGYGNIDGDVTVNDDGKDALVFGSNCPKLRALKKSMTRSKSSTGGSEA
ncbi:hypothetical protein C8J56DRAFT_884716 [Mycena floridula]|nr:hypothetical protein C8J56DRAFT_884716 [Mycena floridula]